MLHMLYKLNNNHHQSSKPHNYYIKQRLIVFILHLPLRSHFVDRIHGSHLLMHADGDFIWRVCRHAGADTLSSSPSRHLRDGATPAISRENKKDKLVN
jgi:hypothetical protein